MRLIWIIIALSAASLGFFWLTDVPLGVSTDDFGVWNRHAYDAPGETTGLLINMVVAVVVAGVYVFVAWFGLKNIESSGRFGRAMRLTALVGVGFFWLSAVQRCTPLTYGAIKPSWVLYDRGSAGYFLDSVTSEESTAEFLAGYEDELAKGDVLHIGTHPPGLFLVNRGLLSICEASSGLTDALLSIIPADMELSFRTVEAGAEIAPKLTDSQRAALWLSVLLTQLAAASAVVVVYWLIRAAEVVRVIHEATIPNGDVLRTGDDQATPASTAWMAAALWPLIPAVAVFLPKSDAVFPFLFTMILPIWFTALHRRSLLLAGLTGLLIWANAMLTLAVLPVVVVLGLATLMLFRFQWRDLYQRFSLPCVLPVLLVFGGCCAAFWAATGVDLANVWTMNLKNHAGFYEQFQRTRWKWMLINPLELSLSVGVPITILAVAAIYRSRSRIVERWRRGSIRPVLFQAAIATWLLLWLSGKNNGEAARLWLFLMPWGLWVASGAFTTDSKGLVEKKCVREWKWLLVIQVAVAIGTVSRVAGFHF